MWIEEFYELLFKTLNSKEDTNKAIKLKYENMPDLMYKYRTASDDHLEALKNNILYASAPSCLNDPYEGSLYVDLKKRWKELYKTFLNHFYEQTGLRLAISVEDFADQDSFIIELAKCMGVYEHEKKYFKDMWSIADKMVEVRLQKFQEDLKTDNDELHRICSFSNVNDSTPMWSHYSAGYTGFCIGYNIKELNNDLTELLFPVRYTDEILEVDDSFFNGGKPNSSFYIDSLTRKSTQWSYEHEWRLLLLAKSQQKSQAIDLPIPKQIILGKNISEENENKIIQIASINNVPCFKHVMRKDNYAFELIEL
jgi:hypothetical protein